MTEQPEIAIPKEPEKKAYKFKVSYRFFFIDYFLRWGLYGGWRYGVVKNWQFWVGQAVVIPIIVIILILIRHSWVQRKYPDVEGSKIYSDSASMPMVLMFFGAILGAYITYSLYPAMGIWAKTGLTALIFVFYLFYLLIVVAIGIQKEPKEKPGIDAETNLTDDEWRDENDRLIVKLETDKLSLSQRVDAYTLESALFGALSFSGFLTIIASEKPVITGVQSIVNDFSTGITMLINFQFNGLTAVVSDITDNHTLLAAIAVQTLICSMFFLSVIISRLRFNDVLRRVDYAIRIASFYNDKEEDIFNLKLQDIKADMHGMVETRLQNLKTKMSESIYYAEEQSLKGLIPIVRYMAVFRNLGVISFLLILISSALWISKGLALIFTALATLGYVYPMFDRWLRDRSLSGVPFFQRGIRFFPHLSRNK
jgi:hypothetical protein